MESDPGASAPGEPANPGDLVVLADERGAPVGTADRLRVHGPDTPLHLAFSAYLINPRGQVLFTRRALTKKTWPGVWTNSCCGHPRPGEGFADAARRRIREELGVSVGPLTCVLPDFRYRAVDASGVVEHEVCPVFVGHVTDDALEPDPGEVSEHRWVDWAAARESIRLAPHLYSPWAVLQAAQLDAALPAHLPASRPALAQVQADVTARLRAALTALDADWRGYAAGAGVDVLPDDLPGWLGELLLGHGKRLRVSLALWGFLAAGGGSAERYGHLVDAAAALETLHLFALIHDDVMDASTSRRGAPTAHVQAAQWLRDHGGPGDPAAFGTNLAILIGDLAHTVADQLAAGLPEPLSRLWFATSVELIAGQRADLTGAAAGRRDHAHAEHVARLKSGRYSVERPLELGALAAGADRAVLRVLQRWGDEVGRAFALRDDLLGVWGDPAVTGKPAGDDLAQAKPTVILALADARLAGDDRDALARLGTPELRPGDVDRVRDALAAAGVADTLEERITACVAAADAALDPGVLTAEGIEGLRRTARDVAWRQS